MTNDELDIVEAKIILGRRYALERSLEFRRGAWPEDVRVLLRDAAAIATWLESGNIPDLPKATVEAA